MKIRPKLSGAPLAYALAQVEGTVDPYTAFGKALWSDEQAVSAALKELVFLRSSLINECHTCVSAHVVSARRRGITEAEVEALEKPESWDEVFDEKARVALRLADALCGETGALDPDLVADLRTHFTEPELAELILVAGQANLNNRVGNAAKQVLGPATER